MPAPLNLESHSHPILVGCALRLEVRLLRDRIGGGCDWIATGLGAAKTRRTLDRRFAARRPRLFIFTGAAGALSDRLAVGDVAFPEIWRLEDGREWAGHAETLLRLRRRGLEACGVGLSLRRPAEGAAARRRLEKFSGALVCDMESAAALETAARFGVPAVAFKVVSDTVEENVSVEEFKQRLPKLVNPLAARLNQIILEFGGNCSLAANPAAKAWSDQPMPGTGAVTAFKSGKKKQK